MPTTPRQKAALAVLAGLADGALAGCTAAGTTTSTGSSDTVESSDQVTESTDSTTDTTTEADTETAGASTYTDGTYTESGSYQTPNGTESVEVTLTLEGDIVTAVTVTGSGGSRDTEQYQSQFIGAIADEVVGVDLDDLSVDRVAGSSLTSTGFNDAVDAIKADAA